MPLPIQTAEFWNDTADQYVASAEPFTAMFCEDAAELAQIEPGLTLLDVATGPGALALAAARRGARVTAIDFSQAMVDRLAGRIGELPIVARQMDGQALALDDASFDRVCSVFGVPLFPDWRAGLAEIARVLRPGGLAVVATADNGHGFGPNQFLAMAREEVTGVPAPVEMDAWAILADRDHFAKEMRTAGLGRSRPNHSLGHRASSGAIARWEGSPSRHRTHRNRSHAASMIHHNISFTLGLRRFSPP